MITHPQTSMPPEARSSHSAQVRMWLEVGEQRIALSHLAKAFLIAKEPVELEPCDATVVFTVDGERTDRRVRLVDGMSASAQETAIVTLP